MPFFLGNAAFASPLQFKSINDVDITLVEVASITKIFNIINNKTGFHFSYNSQKINMEAEVNIKVVNGKVSDVLNQISKETVLSFKQMDSTINVKHNESKRGIKDTKESQNSTGVVIGMVMDEQTNEALPGASIKIVGKTIGAVSDMTGNFFFHMESGSYEVQITYLGYESKTVAITVVEGQTTALNVSLISATYELGDVTINVALEGQQKALNQQQNASNIKNVVAADQIGRFPDSNTAEALQRVPGININRNAGDGEGRYVGVRGLPAYFTNVNINGEQIPSPEGEVRQTALDAIPADQLAYMEVSKSITPEMDGDAIGGSINLVTRGATKRVLEVKGSIGTEVQQNNPEQLGQQYAVQFAKRFGGDPDDSGKFGVLLNTTFYQSNRNVDMVEMDYDDNPDGLVFEEYELEDAYYIRKRLGVSGRFDFKPNAHTEFYLNTIYTQLFELDESRRWYFNEADNEIAKRIKYRQENQGVQSYNLGAKHILPNMTIDYEGSISLGNAVTPYEHLPVFGISDDNLSINIDRSNVDRPQITSATLNGQPFDWKDNSNYRFIEHEYSGTSAHSRNITGKFNLEMPWKLAENNGSIKFGAKVRSSYRDYKKDFFELYEYAGGGDAPALNEHNFTNGGDRDFNHELLGGDYELGASPEWENTIDYIKNNPNDFEDVGAEDFEEEEANTNYEISEDVYAGYVMGTMNFSKLMVLGGLRFEATKTNVKTQIWDATEDAILPIEGNNNYNYFLPMLHFKYAANESLNLRMAGTYSYARPNFGDLVSDDKAFDADDQEAFIGNPNLKPVGALNLDFMVERYFGSVGILSGGLFYKKLDDFIYIQTNNQTFLGVDDITVYQSVNGDQAQLYGFELAYQQNLKFLPGFLSGLGVYANYTLTRGKTEFNNRANRFDENNQPTTREEVDILPGQSENIVNLALSYAKGGFQCRFTANYNSAFLDGVGYNSLSDEYVESRWQFDASASQMINKNLSIYAEFVNISNSENRTYYGAPNVPKELRNFGFWSRFGIKFSL
ncbi:hypothetical protein APS56_15030 [Pseudalgibacter alginicilyticus]|uniref:TonB-dependent receptor n=2 Tax=Pseudalgibacter alginicilyticus TaxID=1736674 RepID=A0A0P0CJF4_9FLAO|nr:hypothetical protein APS56_15030 [Pseudalgibacter alginicilyticus]